MKRREFVRNKFFVAHKPLAWRADRTRRKAMFVSPPFTACIVEWTLIVPTCAFFLAIRLGGAHWGDGDFGTGGTEHTVILAARKHLAGV